MARARQRITAGANSISLSRMTLGPQECLELAELLGTDNSVTSLDIQCCRLKSEDLGALGALIETNKQLRVLRAGWSGGGRRLDTTLKALGQHPSLCVLDL